MKISKLHSKKFLALFAITLFGAVATFVTMHRASAAQFHGAIYTSSFDGTITNQNIYPSKLAVYLNGGPQNNNANGLPDGTYYYQVTNPSGSVLLSTDPARCRQVLIAGGRFSTATGPCPHANGVPNSSNGSTPVQLYPFDDTPNNGGEYKVWLIRQASNTVIVGDQLTSPVLSFINSNAKTDNFKVENDEEPCPDCGPQTVILSGHKFYDANANTLDDDNQSVEGVKIKITLTVNGEVQEPLFAFTDANGNWSLENVPLGASYIVEEVLPETGEVGSYWVQTAPVADSNNFQGYSGTADADVNDLDFGDVCFSPGSGGFTLGYWSNKNGERTMRSTSGVNTNVYPTVSNNPTYPEAGPGITGDLNFLSRMNLKGEATYRKNPVTVDFNPQGTTGYNDFKNWLLNANAYNMSYMLSVQLAATSLDVRHSVYSGALTGGLSDSTIVDARTVCNQIGDCLGFITIGEVRRLADASLGASGGNITISGSAHRDSQELMKNFLDAVNNNRLAFADAEPCGVVYPEPTPTPTPTL